MMTREIALITLAYLFGAIPFGLLLTRRSGVDIRQQGSGNIGATNVTRLAGKKLGLATLLADLAKGALPMGLADQLLPAAVPHHDLVVALCGAAAVLGHMFPVYLRFRGGKGVATGLGVFLYLAPLAALLSVLVFVATVALSGYVSLGSLLAAAAMAPWLWLLEEPVWKMALAAFVAVMIWLKHQQNLRRLLSGSEKSWKGEPSQKS